MGLAATDVQLASQPSFDVETLRELHQKAATKTFEKIFMPNGPSQENNLNLVEFLN